MSRETCFSWLVMGVLSLLVGCGEGREPVKATDGGPEDGLQIPLGQDVDPRVDSIPPTMCYVDFPCGQDETMHCVNERQYQAVETFSCEHFCGDQPCSGAACVEVGPVLSCPDGLLCVQTAYGMGDYCGLPDAGVDSARVDAGSADSPHQD